MEVKPGYKKTVIGVIPEEWEVSRLGDLAQTSSGTTPARAMHDRYYKNGTIGWVKTLDLRNTELLATSEWVTKLALKETCLKIYPAGTVLVAMYGGFQQIGRTGLLRIPAALNQAITAIQPNGEVLSSEYLLAMLNYRVGYWKHVASSSRKDPNISSQDIREFPIAYPKPPEQRAITEALSEVNALLVGLDRLIAKKRDLKQAVMQQLLTGQTRLPGFHSEWEVKRLGDVVQIKKGQLITSSTVKEGSIPVIAGGKQPTYFHASANRFGRTVTISASGASAGYIALYDEPIFASDCSTISESESYCIDFVFYQLQCKQQTIYKAQTGGAQPHIHAKDLNPIPFLFPSFPEQSAIAEVLMDMDAELAALEQRREKSSALKQGMMQELLTGRTRLVVTADSTSKASQ